MDTHLSADLTEHLPQQCKQSHYHLSGLLVSVLALLPILKVHVFYIVALEYSGGSGLLCLLSFRQYGR